MTHHIYTAFLGWGPHEVEEVDFTAPGDATPQNVLAEAGAYIVDDYKPGWTIIGIIDTTSNEVVYNPLDLPTTHTWWVTT